MAISFFTNQTSNLIQFLAELDVPSAAIFDVAWRGIWKEDLEAEKILQEKLYNTRRLYVAGLTFKNGILQSCRSFPGVPLFFNKLINPLLRDMLKSPLEREFLLKLMERAVLVKKNIGIFVVVRRVSESLFQIRTASATDSLMVHFDLCTSFPILGKDKFGKHHLFLPPLRRILLHELIHAYHYLKDERNDEIIPFSKRWTTGEEMRTVHSENLKIKGIAPYNKFSENSFSKYRGEMERVAYGFFIPKLQNISALVEQTLIYGAEGTLERIRFDVKQLNFLALISAYERSPHSFYVAETTTRFPPIDDPFDKEMALAKIRTMKKLIWIAYKQGYPFIAKALEKATVDRH